MQELIPNLGSECQLTLATSVPTLVPTIAAVRPDAIFLDISLCWPEPLQVVRRVRGAAPSTPLIILANPADKQFAALSLAEGAQDYLLKGYVDARTVERVLRAALERAAVAAESPEVLRDALTGLYNARGFETLAERALQRTRRAGGTLLILWVREEKLEAVRAELGSKAAERLQMEIAEVLAGSFRRSDLLGRVAEGEFVVLAAEAGEASAPLLGHRLETRLAQQNRAAGRKFPLTVRVGSRLWSAESDVSLETLMRESAAAAGAPIAGNAPRPELVTAPQGNRAKD
ncbi:MAG: diguanylate cyclase [Acidobacteriia bacterium]|nr:diguanylate cyclase [Terriglobia bacterium]